MPVYSEVANYNLLSIICKLIYTWGRNGFDGIVEPKVAGRGFS